MFQRADQALLVLNISLIGWFIAKLAKLIAKPQPPKYYVRIEQATNIISIFQTLKKKLAFST